MKWLPHWHSVWIGWRGEDLGLGSPKQTWPDRWTQLEYHGLSCPSAAYGARAVPVAAGSCCVAALCPAGGVTEVILSTAVPYMASTSCHGGGGGLLLLKELLCSCLTSVCDMQSHIACFCYLACESLAFHDHIGSRTTVHLQKWFCCRRLLAS